MLDYAAEIVKKCGGKMYLLHVVGPCALDSTSYMPPEDSLGGFNNMPTPNVSEVAAGQQLLNMADARAKGLAKCISKKWGVPIYGKAEEHEDVVECVHAFCDRHHINMLAVGNRHHSLLGSLLLGNTAEKLMRHSRIPITIVPSQSEEA